MKITNDRGLGYVRVDEEFLGINSITFEEGGIYITALLYGPKKPTSGVYRIFGHDGIPVTENVPGVQGTADIPALKAHQVYELRLRVRLDGMVAGNTGKATFQ